jgi:hypothetical protein
MLFTKCGFIPMENVREGMCPFAVMRGGEPIGEVIPNGPIMGFNFAKVCEHSELGPLLDFVLNGFKDVLANIGFF